MVNLNTHGRCLRPNLFSELALKVLPRVSGALKGGLMATLFLCCFSQNAHTQCTNPSINCKANGTVNVILGGSGTSPIPYTDVVLSYDDMCNTCVPEPTFIVSPNIADCGDVGSLNVVVTITNCGDSINQCSTLVNVIDNIAATVSAFPTTMSFSAQTGTCGKVVSDTIRAVILDNCLDHVTYSIDMATPVTIAPTMPGIYELPTTLFSVGSHTVLWTAHSTSGATETAMTTVIITDDEAPTIVGCPGNIVVSNDLDMCSAIVSWTEPTLSMDNCSNATLMKNTSPGAEFPVGDSIVVYTWEDVAGNESICTFTVTVEDNQLPEFGFLPPNQTVSPPSNSCYAPMVLGVGTVTDNCDMDVLVTFAVTGDTTFSGVGDTIIHSFSVGNYSIEFTATDDDGNIEATSFTLTVEDLVRPTALCQATYTASLDANGMITVSAIDLDNGSFDNCPGVLTYEIRETLGVWKSDTTFTCADIGSHPLLFRVVDVNGNSSNNFPSIPPCSVTIDVVDNTGPQAMCKDSTVYLDASGMVTINVADVDNGSSDNCTDPVTDFRLRKGASTFGIFPIVASLTFDCSELGLNVVTLRVADGEGNVGYCQSEITVRDSFPPIAIVNASLNLPLDSGGEAFVTVPDIDNGSNDGSPIVCGIDTMRIGFSAAGPFTDTLFFDCGYLTGNPHAVYLEVTDVDGNVTVSSSFTNVTVQDLENPVLVCPSDTIKYYLDANGEVDVLASEIGVNSTDNCSVVEYQIRKVGVLINPGWDNSQTYDCAEVGVHDVRLWVRDASNNPTPNTSTLTPSFNPASAFQMYSVNCPNAIEIIDDIDPVAICNDVTVALGSNGEVSIPAASVSLGSTDNCYSLLLPSCPLDREVSMDGGVSWDANAFYICDSIGPRQVMVRITDCHNNESTCPATITIKDTQMPTITPSCVPNVTVEWVDGMNLDPTSIDSKLEVEVDSVGPNDALAADNCEVNVSWTDLDTVFSTNCDLDGYTFYILRKWVVVDGNPNMKMCTQTIFVNDTTPPVFSAPADTVLNTCPDIFSVASYECGSWVQTTDIDIPEIGPSPPDTIVSTLNVPVTGNLSSIVVQDLRITHTSVGQLKVWLTSPSGNNVQLLTTSGCTSDNINMDLDDNSMVSMIPCPPNAGNTYQPFGALSDFYGKEINGNWTLTIVDTLNNDGGALTNWGLDICYVTHGDTTSTGGVVAVDACDKFPTESYVDYQAFKGFTENTANTAPSATTYNFMFSQWGKDSTALVVNNAPASVTLKASPWTNKLHRFSITAPASGWIAFDYTSTMDVNDTLKYFVNGDSTILAMTATPTRVLVPVSNGNTFGFSQESNGVTPHRQTIISNFVFVDEDIFPVPADTCRNQFCVARIWDVKDACENQAASQLQIIQTKDETAPEFDLVDDILAETDPDECTAHIDLVRMVIDACGDVTVTHDGPFGSGNDASGDYAPGTYTITFTATDECGNDATDVVVITVEDNQFPTAICLPNVNINLGSASSVTLPVGSVNLGSSDNCQGLQLSVSPSVYNMPGQFAATLTATDADGNVSTCPTTINVIGGPEVVFDAGNAAGNAGSIVTFPVTVTNFTNVKGFVFKIAIADAAVATFEPATGSGQLMNVLPALSSISVNATNPDTLVLSWFNLPGGINILDGTEIFKVQVKLNGTLGQSTPTAILDTDVVNGGGGTVASAGVGGIISVSNPASQFTISGVIKKAPAPCDELPVGNAAVNVTNTTSVPASPITNAAGMFSFTVAQGSNPTLTPAKNTNWSNGVTVADITATLNHITGAPLFNSPYKMIAADVTGEGTISISDVSGIGQMIFGNPIGGQTSWRFVNPATFTPAAITLANRFNVPAYQNTIGLTNVQANLTTNNFVGVKTGDVTCDANGQAFAANPIVSDGTDAVLPFFAEEVTAKAGEDVVMLFKSNSFDDIAAYQFTVNFDKNKLEFQEFTPIGLPNLFQSNFSTNRVEEGLLATTWYNSQSVTLENGQQLFALKFKALTDISAVSQLVSMSSDFIQAMAVKSGQEIIGTDLVFEGVTTSASELEGTHFALLQNRPNPVSSRTSIGFVLPEGGPTTLTFFDASGKVWKVFENEFSAGYHQVTLDRKDLPTSGVVFYRLDTEKHSAVKKMVILD